RRPNFPIESPRGARALDIANLRLSTRWKPLWRPVFVPTLRRTIPLLGREKRRGEEQGPPSHLANRTRQRGDRPASPGPTRTDAFKTEGSRRNSTRKRRLRA